MEPVQSVMSCILGSVGRHVARSIMKVIGLASEVNVPADFRTEVVTLLSVTLFASGVDCVRLLVVGHGTLWWKVNSCMGTTTVKL